MAYVLCFDFDDTLVYGHFHNALQGKDIHAGKATESDLDALFTEEGKSLKNPEYILGIMRKALAAGNHIAIVSFTFYPEIIKPTLKKIGLTDEELEHVYVRGGFPSDNNPCSPLAKSEHLADVMTHFNIEDKKHVVLIDDSRPNIYKARCQGYLTVAVPKGYVPSDYCAALNSLAPRYITEIYQHIDNLTPKPANPLAQTICNADDWAALDPSSSLERPVKRTIEEVNAVEIPKEKRACRQDDPASEPVTFAFPGSRSLRAAGESSVETLEETLSIHESLRKTLTSSG